MSEFVNSLRRLFLKGKIAIFKLEEMKNNKKITQEEYDYIIKKEG